MRPAPNHQGYYQYHYPVAVHNRYQPLDNYRDDYMEDYNHSTPIHNRPHFLGRGRGRRGNQHTPYNMERGGHGRMTGGEREGSRQEEGSNTKKRRRVN